ncbi:MAG: SpoIIIAH-like family protein [Lachnospiraceae bacterium]|nr:SpoIIIAH-like family protein [Lachnospiraceae bacterium]
MKKKIRKNQIIITALAVMIAVAGYLSFTNKEVTIIDENGNPVAAGQENDLQETLATDDPSVQNGMNSDAKGVLTDAELSENTPSETAVSTDETNTAEFSDAGNLASADDETVPTGAEGNSDDAEVSAPVNDSIGEAVLTSVEVRPLADSDVIINAKLNREQTRSKSQELLMQLVNNESLEENVKENAVNELIAMTDRMEKESVCEQQLLAKGFGECVVLISDESVDVTVNRKELSEIEKAQIEDIITRKAECDVSKVVITMAQ